MTGRRIQSRISRRLLAAALLASAGASSFPACSRPAPGRPGTPAPAPAQVTPGRRPVLGRITKVDPGGKLLTIDRGAAAGLTVGMELEALRPAPDPAFSDDGTELAWLKVIALGETESTAEILFPSDEPEGGIRPGDRVLAMRSGRVTAYDPRRAEARIDLGRADGALAGSRFNVDRPDPPGGPDRPEAGLLPSLEITSVRNHESTARAVLPAGDRWGLVDPELVRKALQPGDELFPEAETDRASLRNEVLATGDRPDALRRLGLDRLDLARRNLSRYEDFYQAGMISIDRLIDASRRLLAASRDSATTPDQQIAALRAHLGRMTRLASREALKLQVGAGSDTQLDESRYAQAEAALLLARALRHGPNAR